MLTLRPARQRGHASFGWLNSYHSFSFGRYHDPRHMGVSALRVINDDFVRPGSGFESHGHRNMEIISYVIQGSLEHRDSLGHGGLIEAGEFQLMSAGRGIRHSEFNPSNSESLNFLQIWIEPNQRDGEPGYQQQPFEQAQVQTLIASPDGRNGSLRLRQDALLYRIRLAQPGDEHRLELATGRTGYLHVVKGTLSADKQPISTGDGLTVRQQRAVTLRTTSEDSELLLFDLP